MIIRIYSRSNYSKCREQQENSTKNTRLREFADICKATYEGWNFNSGNYLFTTDYLQLIQNRYMFRSFTVLHCSHQHCVQPVASYVEVVGYL